MILILSTEVGELSTEDVIDWLHFYNQSYYRINGEYLNGQIPYSIEIDNKCQSNYLICSDVLETGTENVKVIWYRRWNGYKHLEYINTLQSSQTAISIYGHLKAELTSAGNNFFLTLNDKLWFDHPSKGRPSKIDTLNKAKACGFIIPDTIITNSKERLKSFLKQNARIITKPIVDGGAFFLESEIYILYTYEVSDKDLDKIPDYFYPSLFQKLIDKKIELRVFYLDGTCYAMAIFSQNNSQTNVDFRIYDADRPNRTVPYVLPPEIVVKIKKLMDLLQLKSGSIDIILSDKNEYVFLEVNPAGQFGMVSYPCNYNLEKKVADYLVSKNE
jgi:ATP-GRASP peptide maturase of grasp-with-spasm system